MLLTSFLKKNNNNNNTNKKEKEKEVIKTILKVEPSGITQN